MKTLIGLCSCLLFFSSTALAATHYVDINCTNPVSPYTNWVTAATNIQDAIDVAVDGAMVLVADGHYLLTSMILVTKGITIQSVNGPEVTIVDGQGSVTCFYLGSQAPVISGLTITNGYSTGSGGGISCSGIMPLVTNCTIIGNHAAVGGGGMYVGTANNCVISGNSAANGGGKSFGTANNCIMSGNTAEYEGGGIYNGTASNCVITSNHAGGYGGGLSRVTVNNSLIIGNSAGEEGGGIYDGSANNCAISGNSAPFGGGISQAAANNCTISGNTAFQVGGGVAQGAVYNSILWYNQAPLSTNLYSTFASYSCSPDVTHGVDGNITNIPVLVSASHVATNSSCREAGSATYASGKDIDGEAWLDPPSMGCDEYTGSVTGALQVAIDCASNVVVGYSPQIRGQIVGAVSRHVWNFDDGTSENNNVNPEHTWNSMGNYALTLTAYNDSYPSGIVVTQMIHVVSLADSTVYVAVTGNDTNDGSSWTKAKATIQCGIEAQEYEGGRIWISNGTYVVTSEIVVAENVLIQSMNGPEYTIVDGQDSVRCFNLGNNACVLSGLTITKGNASGDAGGGVSCLGLMPIVTNCLISGNTADWGGGMFYGTAYNCTISSNYSSSGGGGIGGGTANNCAIRDNSAGQNGGGLHSGTANNCVIRGNDASAHGGGLYYGAANNCVIIENNAGIHGNGGGLYRGTANNCVISSNNAGQNGGGMSQGAANGCLFYANSAGQGGGMDSGTANNCTIVYNTALYYAGGMTGTVTNSIIWYNEALNSPDYGGGGFIYNTCSPSSPYFVHCVNGNTTNAPLFVDQSNGNFRLRSISPCINAGDNAAAIYGTDLDGNPRIIDGTVDMGAYEAFYVTNSYPYAPGFALEWMSVPEGWNSTVKYSTNLIEMPFTNLSAPMTYPANSYTDLVHGAASECFYKVEIAPQ